MRKTLTPKTARTNDQLASLKRDNISTKDSWILADEGSVTICNQKAGEPSTGSVTLSRATFERFVRWYETGATR